MKPITSLRKERRILVEAIGNEAISAVELAYRLRTAKNLSPQLRSLVDDGYLQSRKEDRVVRFSLRPEVQP